MRKISIALVALIALGLSACGGGGDSESSDTTVANTTASDDTTTSAAISASTITKVDKDAWYTGFKLTLGDATFTSTPTPNVVIATTFENLGGDSATFNGQLVLTSGGNSVTSTDLLDIPEVPGGTTGKGTLKFNVEEDFVFEDAVLTIGASDNNQATVPLGAEGTYTSLEPVPVAVAGTATAGQLVIKVAGGEIRADIPDTHDQSAKDELALTVDFDATNNGTGGGGYPFTADNLALTLPDGTTVAPDDAPIELLGHQATLKNLSVRFTVDEPAAGKYVLLLKEGETTGKLPFTIAAATTAATTTVATTAP